MSRPEIRCLIAIGSNLGDRLENLRSAVSGLAAAEGVDVLSVSDLYETAPIGGPHDQGAFYNAAVLVDTTLAAHELLALLHRLEAARERRRVIHWGPRTLDLDLLVYGDSTSDDPELLLPHPRMHLRRFVLVPVCDIAPDLVHPRLDSTMSELLAAIPPEPGDLATIASDWETVIAGSASG